MQIDKLFRGYSRAHGQFTVKRTGENGKAEGKALTLPGGANADHWAGHLSGKGPGLGVIPLLDDDTVAWACIDVDVYDLDHAALEAKTRELGLPLVLARSKSGGAHCFVFLDPPAPAVDVRAALEAWAAAMGHGGCEIFPKQVGRFNADDLGNWLNMPYFNEAQTVRYGIKDGAPLSLSEFEAWASACVVDIEAIQRIKVIGRVRQAAPQVPGRRSTLRDVDLPDNSGPYEDGPPCLQVLEAQAGFPDGTRNDGMYNVAVFLRKKFPDDWRDRLPEYNLMMCNPPLTLSEINTIAKSVQKKEYGYRCRLEPICSFCNKRTCQQRKYGVGELVDSTGRPDINQLTKHAGDPVIWFAEIVGQRVMFSTEELLNQNSFKRKIAEAINRVLPSVPQPRWDSYIDSKMRECDVVEVPVDATPTGQFQMLVQQFATGRAQAKSKEELVHRLTPFFDGGVALFRSRGLIEYLDNHGYRYKSEHHIWQMLRDMGATSKFLNIKGNGVNVWALPMAAVSDDGIAPPNFGEVPF